jgi:DNA-binding transcriptional MerR regulator
VIEEAATIEAVETIIIPEATIEVTSQIAELIIADEAVMEAVEAVIIPEATIEVTSQIAEPIIADEAVMEAVEAVIIPEATTELTLEIQEPVIVAEVVTEAVEAIVIPETINEITPEIAEPVIADEVVIDSVEAVLIPEATTGVTSEIEQPVETIFVEEIITAEIPAAIAEEQATVADVTPVIVAELEAVLPAVSEEVVAIAATPFIAPTEATAQPVEIAPVAETLTLQPEVVVTKKKRTRKVAEVTGEESANEAPAASNNLPMDWEGHKTYYTIGEVAALFKVKTSHIRFWTNEFKLKVRTTRKGDRLYTPELVKEVRAIYHLVKERGFTLAGAKARLKSASKKEVETVDLKQSLQQLRSQLVTIKNQL